MSRSRGDKWKENQNKLLKEKKELKELVDSGKANQEQKDRLNEVQKEIDILGKKISKTNQYAKENAEKQSSNSNSSRDSKEKSEEENSQNNKQKNNRNNTRNQNAGKRQNSRQEQKKKKEPIDKKSALEILEEIERLGKGRPEGEKVSDETIKQMREYFKSHPEDKGANAKKPTQTDTKTKKEKQPVHKSDDKKKTTKPNKPTEKSETKKSSDNKEKASSSKTETKKTESSDTKKQPKNSAPKTKPIGKNNELKNLKEQLKNKEEMRSEYREKQDTEGVTRQNIEIASLVLKINKIAPNEKSNPMDRMTDEEIKNALDAIREEKNRRKNNQLGNELKSIKEQLEDPNISQEKISELHKKFEKLKEEKSQIEQQGEENNSPKTRTRKDVEKDIADLGNDFLENPEKYKKYVSLINELETLEEHKQVQTPAQTKDLSNDGQTKDDSNTETAIAKRHWWQIVADKIKSIFPKKSKGKHAEKAEEVVEVSNVDAKKIDEISENLNRQADEMQKYVVIQPKTDFNKDFVIEKNIISTPGAKKEDLDKMIEETKNPQPKSREERE